MRQRRGPTKKRRSWVLPAVGVGVLAVASLAVIVWWAGRADRSGGSSDLDPTVGMDLRTLVGQPAPVLTLRDAEGREYTVPKQGRPTVLIFHMGFF